MRGQKITPTQIEQIKQTYAQTESLTAAAKAATVSIATARKYVHASDEFEKARIEKRTALIDDVAAEFADVRQVYLDWLRRPEVIAATSSRDAAVIVGIMTDKHQLVTGQATERSEHVNTDDARDELTRRLDELAERRAARTHRVSEGSVG